MDGKTSEMLKRRFEQDTITSSFCLCWYQAN